MDVPGEKIIRVEDELATLVQEEFLAFLDRYFNNAKNFKFEYF